jgi:hypothetical protein
VIPLNAQDKKTTISPTKALLLNGITVQTDLASLVSSSLSNGKNYSMEGALQADLKHKYYPIVELGFAGANKVTTDNANFKTNGLFGRLGVDINLITQKKDSKPTNNLFLAGVRLGMTSFAYSISNMQITDNYWGGTEIINYPNQLSTKIWFEIVVGVRVEVIKNIYMGWSVRNKNLLSQDIAGKPAPWNIPGFGLNTGTNWGLNYTLGYHF